MRIGNGRTVAGARIDFATAENAGLNRFLTLTPIHTNPFDDMFIDRTKSKVKYVAKSPI